MPVVTLYANRLEEMLKRDMKSIIEMLPYIALDIEEEGEDYVKVEYNPNRPDFSSDYGIVRALKGLMDIEDGIADYKQRKSNLKIKVSKGLKIRPYIVSLLAKDGSLDEESIRQIISMQEDLHNGLGRRRKKISIGIHDYDKIKSPLIYTTAEPDTRFIPLGESREFRLDEIIKQHELGKRYGDIIPNTYPVIKDAKDSIISFPPIINSSLTQVSSTTKNLLVEITAIDLKRAEDALSILAITLHDAGFKIESVEIDYANKKIVTPNMSNRVMNVDLSYIRDIIGLELSEKEVIKALRRSRLDATIKNGKVRCMIPRYRFDIISDVDIAEEAAIGYGIYNLEPSYPLHKSSGNRDIKLKFIDNAREVMIGLGAIECINFDLISKELLHTIGLEYKYSVEHSKSNEHEILRPSIIPSLLQTLSINVHEPYPQIIFEIGKVFEEQEEYRLACIIASSDSNYNKIKSYLQAFLRGLRGIDAKTISSRHPLLKEGATASIIINERLGVIGEVKSDIVEAFKVRTNLSLFEISLDKLYHLSK